MNQCKALVAVLIKNAWGGRIYMPGQHKRLQVIKTEGEALERTVAS